MCVSVNQCECLLYLKAAGFKERVLGIRSSAYVGGRKQK